MTNKDELQRYIQESEEKEKRLEEYYQACVTGEIDNIKTNTEDLNIIYEPRKFKNAIVKATSTNQYEIIKYLFDIFDEEVKKGDLLASQNPRYMNQLRYHGSHFNFDNYENPILVTCKNGYLNIFKLFFERLGGLSIHRYERCSMYASQQGQLEIMKFLLSTSDAKTYINQKKYYNHILFPSSIKGNNVTKYFLDNENLSIHVKQLPLLERAYENSNKEIIDYLIFEKNMLYSKKIRKAVEGMVNEEYNIPELFKKRNEMQELSQELEENPINSENKRRLKI